VFLMIERRVVAITGAGGGLGRAIAEAFASQGWVIAAIGRTQSELDDTVAAIERAGGVALACRADVADEDDVRDAVRTIERSLGPIDALVNNAAIGGPIGPFWESSPEDWWQTQEVNLRGPMLCTHAAVRTMVARRRGRIVNVVSSSIPMAYFSAYVTSKTAVIRFTECLAAELRPFGVSAFAMAPGTVRTRMSEHSLTSDAGRRWLPWFRRIFDEHLDMPPERPAQLALALASGRADRLSGRFFSTYHDFESMLEAAETIERDNLHRLRIPTIPGALTSPVLAGILAEAGVAREPRD
jgi:NAD(P)-dependent dehydrogenase (short-subunit alcohol dehydrogenase family)